MSANHLRVVETKPKPHDYGDAVAIRGGVVNLWLAREDAMKRGLQHGDVISLMLEGGTIQIATVKVKTR